MLLIISPITMDMSIDEELRHIQLDNGPRLQPLGLDRMISRVHQWAESHPSTSSTSSTIRAPSPIRRRAVYPLPRPQEGVSPLGGIFDYPELLPLVLMHFEHPRELAVLARVCRSWCKLARRKLYDHIWVRPWEDGCRSKLVSLFDTLHRNPELCKLVHKLDVRFFPLSARGGERLDLDEQVCKAMEQMQNLESLVWTRDTSLTPELVEVISAHPHLRSLEISGHSYRYYDPKSIGGSPNLEELRVMMPDTNFKNCLLGIVKELDERDQGGLQGLGIICRSSPLIDDELLKSAALSLRNLRRLTLWGCTRVTKSSVYKILDEATDLQELSLDILPHSELLELTRAPGLDHLHTLSLSFYCPTTRTALAIEDLPSLPNLPNLSSLHLTLSGEKRDLPSGALEKLYTQIDPGSLRRLSLLNLIISTSQLSTILTASPSLEELYISLRNRQTFLDCSSINGCNLKILHINTPPEGGLTSDDLVQLAKEMKDLDQIGTGNRVYEVWRSLGDDEEKIVELSRWGRTTTPAYFQIWRG